MTNEEALAAWDAGNEVDSCSQGGLGKRYEQVIQVMGFEMLRAMLANPCNWDEFDTDDEKWRAYRDKIEAVPEVSNSIEKMEPSTAQFGSAMNLASVFARHGYEKACEMIPEDRRIKVKKELVNS